MGRSKGLLTERTATLIDGFADYLTYFESEPAFTGPSLYFHHRTLDVLREHGAASKALDDDYFLELVYATLTAWGMHRMGDNRTKLIDFEKLKANLHGQKPQIETVKSLSIESLDEAMLEQTAQLLWSIIEASQTSVSDKQLVAGSKTLHHLVPALVPPIDGQYTLRFFYDSIGYSVNNQNTKFFEIFSQYHAIATATGDEISRRLASGGLMNTSPTKIIDNAIVGFVRKNLS